MIKEILIGVGLLFSAEGYCQHLSEDSLTNRSTELLVAGQPAFKPEIRNTIRLLAGIGSESALAKASTIAFIMGDYPLCDSINTLTAQRYPHGIAARNKEYTAIVEKKYSAKDAEKAFLKWMGHFPDTSATDHELHDAGRGYLAELYSQERNYSRAAFWLSAIFDRSEKAKQEINNAVWALNNGDTAAALGFQRSGVEQLKKYTGDSSKPVDGSYYQYLGKYAQLLYREKQYPTALTVITEVYRNRQQPDLDLTRLYATILTANQKGKEALPLLDSLLKTGKGDQALLRVLEDAYRQATGSLQGYDSYVAGLQAEMRKRISEKLPPKRLDLPAPLFSLSTMKEQKVSLNQLKGKVVILDFWATWCGPCKRSFPAMKQAIQHFQADTLVKFLFIDCMERGSNYRTLVKDFINSHQYPFEVLFDDQPDKVFEAYGVKGIPMKFIIDGNGIIRYTLTGFEDGDDAAVEELSRLIELAKHS